MTMQLTLRNALFPLIISALGPLLVSCSSPYTVSVNNNSVFDPQVRLYTGEVRSADLQGCINFAVRQQNLANEEALEVLACANSEVDDLGNIAQLENLRFLDLGNNRISNLSPLTRLSKLSGLNLSNNQVSDVSPLLRMPALRSLNLSGNLGIPCEDIAALQAKLESNFTPPASCLS